MKRLIATLIIIGVILTGVIWEQVFVNNTFKLLEKKLETLTASVEACADDSVDTEQNKAMVTELYEIWLKKERMLCYLVKHTETFQISDSLIYAKNFIEYSNKEEAILALKKLKYLFSVHHYNVGSSIENII